MASVAFRVPYHLVEPRAASWLAADTLARREFARLVVQLVLKAKDRELAAGLDRHGNRLAAIADSTRRHRRSAMGTPDPDAPPLTPAHGLSRTRSLLAGRAHGDHALFFWRYDEHTGRPWGRTLAYHRAGAGRLPVRDVIGLAPQSLAWVRDQVEAWWVARQRMRTFVQSPLTTGLPTPSANGMPRPPLPAQVVARGRQYRPVAVPSFTHATYHTSRPAEATGPARPGDFATGFRQFKRVK